MITVNVTIVDRFACNITQQGLVYHVRVNLGSSVTTVNWQISMPSGATLKERLVNLAEGENEFTLTKVPMLALFYKVNNDGTERHMPFDHWFDGSKIIINSGDDYTNIMIRYI